METADTTPPTLRFLKRGRRASTTRQRMLAEQSVAGLRHVRVLSHRRFA
jgi:hypothetical protein